MKQTSLLFGALTVLFGLLCPSFALAEVTLSDGDFNPADWQQTIYLQDSGTRLSSVTTEPTGGNPGAHREMVFQWNTGGGTASIYAFFKYAGASYNPSIQGPITTIDYSEDGRVTSDSIGTVNITLPARMALEQDGSIYRSMVASVIQSPPFPGPWAPLSLNGLVAANFPKASGPGPDRPDFSATGGEIFFGYVRANSNSAATREIVTGIDNWSVTINQSANPDYAISKAVLDDAGAEITTAEVGDTVTYRLTFANTGGVDLGGVEVIDTLPEHLQFVSAGAAPPEAVVYDAGPPATVTWCVGAVASGGSASLDIDMEILAGADHLVLTNQAAVAAIDAPALAGQTASSDLEVGTRPNITSELWANAILEVPGNPVTLIWKMVGADITPSGDQVISGYFYADPKDFAYGSIYNPELFVKIYIASNGWCNIAFNHVSVDPVTVFSAHYNAGSSIQSGSATLTSRLVEHQYNSVAIDTSLQTSDGLSTTDSVTGGYILTSDIWAKAALQPVSGSVTLIWKEVGSDTTPSGDRVVSGYFYADPNDFAYGSIYNPEIFVKIYIANNGWCNMAFNHVTVDDVNVYSAHNYAGAVDKTGTVTLNGRLVEHQYDGVSLQ